ncbi:sirtuin [Pseudoalteromonas issachenkonii]|jgi:NAD-dependent protein deacetylase/lipoamidase|uniref:protein acetyllysine N-acetyltransferase n=3 Tax=Pseudoalteromonas TaxID=53246 RepID=A0AB39AUN6_9GAMM|nr:MULTISPECIES: Sir2 family NAD-dependent protein deacetylase [Pseudoalteromonas]ALQ56484.1 sirtuin [Pseudoalteromonas issachenkonii]ATC92424.1 NAD-dependent deacetylase [Pseudoalteromonas issachenkonii]KYL36531.1 sirtuin [Pseudoalteromonas spiralis]MDN3399954.1 Sir2 family NAD-dependent protein deacetylase [Pseudoalteromonas sp. APC 3213]MDN3409173.1 Sir2 family NAD-dependent protein deacetylase [Pseudoalteromonas sp. APC 3894]|tara:strand:+ start:7728 stop:8447 length:720 start_codon:yes stop_codon:yes gene_type:complete
MNTLYITGAGVSAASGIPTFRGEDGFWTIGSKNYTPMEMATRAMYENNPSEFLAWYYHRFATYRHHGPNEVHHWLSDKNLITQNIDGLDGKAENKNYIAIHGRLDQMTVFHHQGDNVTPQATLWSNVDESNLHRSLLALFNIENHQPKLNHSLKPFVLLFDEYYTELYRITEAQQRMIDADKMVFMGTSFSVNITQMALEIARNYAIPIEIVDPEPTHVLHSNVSYKKMTALEYIQQQG